MRNLGVSVAKNEWITFVDADDCVDETLIANYENIINTNNPNVDLVVTGYGIFDHHQNCLGSFSPKHSNVYFRADNGIQTLFEEVGDDLDARGWLCTFVVNKAYRRDILNRYNIRFKPGLGYGEDFLFNAEYYRYINGISTISRPLYYYYKRGSGATSRFWGGDDIIDRRCLFYETSIEMSRNLNFDKEYDNVIYMKEFLSDLIEITEDYVRVGAGVKLQKLIKAINRESLGGIEYLYSVPGLVGGAIILNAGRGRVANQQIRDYLIAVDVLENGKIYTYSNEQCEFKYRSSAFQRKKWDNYICKI